LPWIFCVRRRVFLQQSEINLAAREKSCSGPDAAGRKQAREREPSGDKS